jgi:glyoxylase-like metal-dependent hydrolase (beta-lactamase superfamily II)
VITHAHVDHYGQAATVVERSGCALWMHPNHAHATQAERDPEAALQQRIEIARSAGVPPEPLERWSHARRESGTGIAGRAEPDRPLLPGVEVRSDLGAWLVVETPGHAPSHVCLFQPERRLLISGDHLLGRISLYYDYGFTRDPVGEFLASLDAVEAYGPRLCLPGHGRTFADVGAHIDGNRALVSERLDRVRAVLREHGPVTAFDAIPLLYGEEPTAATASWWLQETLCYLRHLEVTGEAAPDRAEADGPERWRASD